MDENGNGTVHTFAYGADGIRCQKNNIYYTRDGERILIEHNADTGKSITYLYGEKGVVGLRYLGNDYYYLKNIFGDVVAIYNTDGKKVASYEYDAWGKNLSFEDEDTNEIKRINPFRYRSYYYDIETKFYYLNSRYYDPETGRFLNADSLENLGEGAVLKNYNLFTYSENAPTSANSQNNNDKRYTVNNKSILKGESFSKFFKSEREACSLANYVFGASATLNSAIPLIKYYFKNGELIASELKLYGATPGRAAGLLSGVKWVSAADGVPILLSVGLDVLDRYLRGVNKEGIAIGAALTAVKDAALLYLNKSIMWASVAIGTSISIGVGTALGFLIGTFICLAVDYHFDKWISYFIDKIAG